MGLDPRVESAVRDAVRHNDQGEELAAKIVALLQSLGSGNISLSDRDALDRHMEILYNSVLVPGAERR